MLIIYDQNIVACPGRRLLVSSVSAYHQMVFIGSSRFLKRQGMVASPSAKARSLSLAYLANAAEQLKCPELSMQSTAHRYSAGCSTTTIPSEYWLPSNVIPNNNYCLMQADVFYHYCIKHKQ